jgi:hypothetical protein
MGKGGDSDVKEGSVFRILVAALDEAGRGRLSGEGLRSIW